MKPKIVKLTNSGPTQLMILLPSIWLTRPLTLLVSMRTKVTRRRSPLWSWKNSRQVMSSSVVSAVRTRKSRPLSSRSNVTFRPSIKCSLIIRGTMATVLIGVRHRTV